MRLIHFRYQFVIAFFASDGRFAQTQETRINCAYILPFAQSCGNWKSIKILHCQSHAVFFRRCIGRTMCHCAVRRSGSAQSLKQTHNLSQCFDLIRIGLRAIWVLFGRITHICSIFSCVKWMMCAAPKTDGMCEALIRINNRHRGDTGRRRQSRAHSQKWY